MSALSQSVCESFPITAARMLLRMYDSDGDGTVSFTEFRSLYLFLSRIERVFGSLDTGRGLNKQNIEQAFTQIGLSMPDSEVLLPLYIEAFDRFGRGYLEYPVFLELAVWVSFVHHLFARHDTHRAGRLVVDLPGLFSLALWLR